MPGHSQPSTSSRRKQSKRLLVHSDEDGGGDDGFNSRTKRARTSDTDPSVSASTTPGDDIEMDIDVETFSGSVVPDDDRHFLSDDTATHKPRKRKGAPVATTNKSQVCSEDGESEREMLEDDLSDMTPPPAEYSDDDLDLDTPPRRGISNVKASASKGKAKAKSQLKGAKSKGFKDKEKDREIHMKDERRLHPPASPPGITSHSQPSDLFSNDDRAPKMDPLPDVAQVAKDPLSQTIPKKRKLPPIKKTKTAGSATGTQTPSTVSQKPVPPAQDLAKPLPTAEQRKQALTGVRDIDLADSKIYAELFKGAGGNTPKSGIKNAEERRRELDRMRDEARARRSEEAKHTFDLQLQADKIARFEQRLRTENSTALHPNFLAAKFRDEWEMDRRTRRGTLKEGGEA